jgi:TolA-binding protein
LGEMARTAGRMQEAADLFRRVAEDYPKNEAVSEALKASALARLRAGDAAGSLADWDALLERKLDDETAAEARLQKALVLIELKKSKDALEALDALLAERTGGAQTARAQYWRGVLLADKSKWSDAESALRACLAAGPEPQTASLARLRLAVVLQRQDRMDEAADQIEPLLQEAERVAENPALVEWLVRRRFDQGQYERCLAAATVLAENAREPSWRQIGWYWAGMGQSQLGNAKAAIPLFEKAVAEKAATREGAEAQLLLAALELKAGQYDRAAERFAAAAESATGEDALELRARAYFGLGEAAEAAGEPEKAARHFMSVAVLFDDPEWTPHSLYRAGRLFGQVGKKAEQASAWKELKERYPDSSFAKQVEAGTP